MKITVNRETVLMLEKLKGKLLMGEASTIYVIQDFTVERQSVKCSRFSKSYKWVEYLTKCEIQMYYWRGKFVATMTDESVENLIIYRDFYRMRQDWVDFGEQLQHFGLAVIDNKPLNLLEKAFEAGREYQAYKEHANLEEKSWDYTFPKWCEKKGIPVTKTTE
jgi:hypothetical protein